MSAGVFPAEAGTWAHTRHCPLSAAGTASCVLHFHQNAGGRGGVAALRGMPRAPGSPWGFTCPVPQQVSSVVASWGWLVLLDGDPGQLSTGWLAQPPKTNLWMSSFGSNVVFLRFFVSNSAKLCNLFTSH